MQPILYTWTFPVASFWSTKVTVGHQYRAQLCVALICPTTKASLMDTLSTVRQKGVSAHCGRKNAENSAPQTYTPSEDPPNLAKSTVGTSAAGLEWI